MLQHGAISAKTVPGVLKSPAVTVSSEGVLRPNHLLTGDSIQKIHNNCSHALETQGGVGRQKPENHFDLVFSCVNCCPGMTVITKICGFFSIYFFSWPLFEAYVREGDVCI